jgi:hypothetical protein
MIHDNYSYDPREINDSISEKDKSGTSYLTGNINYSIANLVTAKPDMRTAADYYHGIINKSEFKHLEDNYGLGHACDIEFIPLVRKHIEALKGQLLSNPMKFGITCKDEKTLKAIQEAKKLEFLDEFLARIMERMKVASSWAKNVAKTGEIKDMPDILTEEAIKQFKDKFSTDWQSEFEIASQLVLDATLNNVNSDFRTKMALMFENLLVYGSCYYRVELEAMGEDPVIKVINPLDIFYNKNTNDTYINQCTRVVHRFFRTPEELINMFPELDEEEIDLLMNYKSSAQLGNQFTDSRVYLEDILGLNAATNTNESLRYSYHTVNIIECYHVEWLANNVVEYDDHDSMIEKDGVWVPEKKKRYRLDRYSGYRLGTRVFVKMGKDEVIRSQRSPYKCRVSYNGVSHTDMNGKPYSLILKTKALQDKYNIYYFHRDNLVANAGVKGMFVDLSMVPSHMGDTPEERLMAFMAVSKQGFAPINTAQEGSSAMNTVFQSYDNSLDLQAIEGYNLLLSIIEDTVSSITGVPRQMLADIEQREAVGNVQTSMRQAMVMNKGLFNLMDSMMRQSLTDMVDLSKVSFKEGRYGATLLGDYRSKIFSIEPTHFCFSDHDIHVVDTSQITQDKTKIDQLTMELVKAQQLTASIAYDVITSNSLAEANTKAKRGIGETDRMNQQLQQASQKIKELESQIQQLTAQATKVSDNEIKFNEAKIREIDAKIKDNVKARELEEKGLKIKETIAESQIKVEALQIYDDNKMNDEPKNISKGGIK